MSYCNVKHRVVMEIDTRALAKNFHYVKSRTPQCKVLAVLKANAYNFGADEMARQVALLGVDRVGVADLSEALAIQEHLGDIPIQVLGVLMNEEIEPALEHNIVCPVNGLAMAKTVSAAAVKLNKTAKIHVILDTGMGRFGLLKDNYLSEIQAIKALPNLELEGIYSHFPQAGVPGEAGTQQQIADFKAALAVLAEHNIDIPLRHIAASDGIDFQIDSTRAPFNMVRMGLNWYGLDDNPDTVPAVTLKTVVGAVREMPAGSTIGYMRTCKLDKPAKVATICIGYADGFPLALTNCGRVLINGVSCPVLGRVSMDYTTVDVSNVPGEVDYGTPVILWGRSGNEEIIPGEYARLKGTHIHEILCSLGSRVERVYK